MATRTKAEIAEIKAYNQGLDAAITILQAQADDATARFQAVRLNKDRDGQRETSSEVSFISKQIDAIKAAKIAA